MCVVIVITGLASPYHRKKRKGITLMKENLENNTSLFGDDLAFIPILVEDYVALRINKITYNNQPIHLQRPIRTFISSSDID